MEKSPRQPVERDASNRGEGSLKVEFYGDLATITEYAQTKDRAGNALSFEIPDNMPDSVGGCGNCFEPNSAPIIIGC